MRENKESSGLPGPMAGVQRAKVGRSILGIECRHHYGVTTHDLVEGQTVAETVYRLIRDVWHCDRPDRAANVTDDNHTWEVDTRPGGWDRVVLRKNARSPRFLFCPAWVSDGDGAVWFDQEYRVATSEIIVAEVAELRAQQARRMADAARQRDSIRGRKERKRLTSLAEDSDRQVRLIERRWPDLDWALIDPTRTPQVSHEFREAK